MTSRINANVLIPQDTVLTWLAVISVYVRVAMNLMDQRVKMSMSVKLILIYAAPVSHNVTMIVAIVTV